MSVTYENVRKFIDAANEELTVLDRRLVSDKTALAVLRSTLPLDDDENDHPVLVKLAKDVHETEARINELISLRSDMYQEIHKMFPAPVQ